MVYLVTYKSGAQQFIEMDMDDGIRLAYELDEYVKWDALGRPGGQAQRPEVVFRATTGATFTLSEVAGFQHYITEGHARIVADSDGSIADFNDAIDAAIQAMMETAEVEGNEPNGYVAAVDTEAVRVAFLGVLGRQT